MNDKKDIEVSIKVPKGWLSTNDLDFLSLFTGRIKDRVKDKLLDEATAKIMKQIDLPKIKVSPEEIKDRMLTILAEKALEEK